MAMIVETAMRAPTPIVKSLPTNAIVTATQKFWSVCAISLIRSL
jgi:hypothetical protein